MARRPRARTGARRNSNGPTQPKSLRLDLEKWFDGASANARLRFISLTLEAQAGVVEKSPVDTGFFRSHWGISINGSPPPARVQRPENFSGVSVSSDVVAAMTVKIGEAELGDVIWIYNPVVYGPRLEHGHSQQAPRGMVALTIEELRMKYRTQGL